MNSSSSQFFRDPVHGLVELSPAAQVVIQHVGFQRLYSIRQFSCDFVFPYACYYRAQHSIAVANLAKFAVRSVCPNISEKELLWIELAGLLHDSGHGPYSHVFDDILQEMKKTGTISSPNAKLNHEERSIAMTRWILESLDIGLDDKDIQVIQYLIYSSGFSKDKIPEKLDPKKNLWLSEIICNTRHGIDIDRLEYLIRDSAYYFENKNENENNNEKEDENKKEEKQEKSKSQKSPLELVKNIKALLERCAIVDGHWCFDHRDNEFLQELMLKRSEMHENFYNHPQVKISSCMIQDAIIQYAPIINLAGIVCLRTQDDFVAFTRLTDNILEDILNSRQDYLKNSKTLVLNLCTIEHYKWYRYIDDFPQHAPELELYLKDKSKYIVTEWKINKVPQYTETNEETTRNTKETEKEKSSIVSFMDLVDFHQDKIKIVKVQIPPSISEKLKENTIIRVFERF